MLIAHDYRNPEIILYASHKSYSEILVYNLCIYSAVFDCRGTMVFTYTMCVSLERRSLKAVTLYLNLYKVTCKYENPVNAMQLIKFSASFFGCTECG